MKNSCAEWWVQIDGVVDGIYFNFGALLWLKALIKPYITNITGCKRVGIRDTSTGHCHWSTRQCPILSSHHAKHHVITVGFLTASESSESSLVRPHWHEPRQLQLFFPLNYNLPRCTSCWSAVYTCLNPSFLNRHSSAGCILPQSRKWHDRYDGAHRQLEASLAI